MRNPSKHWVFLEPSLETITIPLLGDGVSKAETLFTRGDEVDAVRAFPGTEARRWTLPSIRDTTQSVGFRAHLRKIIPSRTVSSGFLTHIKLRGKSRAMADGCRLRNGSGMVGRQSTSCCKPVTKIPTTVKAARGRRHTPCLFHAVMLEPMPNRVARYNQLRPVHGPNMLQRPLSRHNDATTPQGHHFSNTINKTSIQIEIRMTVKLM